MTNGTALPPPSYAHSPRWYVGRYVTAVVIIEFFAYKVLDPYYLQFMMTEPGLGLSATQFGYFVALASSVTFAIDFLTGAFADKIGRRASWSIAMFLYGGGMVWLSFVQSYRLALITAVCMGSSYAFISGSKEAWLYDNVGRDGMREAFGRVYLLAVPVTIVGGLTATALGIFNSLRLPILIAGLVVLANGLFVTTLPENRGAAVERSWRRIMVKGFREFAQNRVLWLTAAQSFFMTLPIWINTAWWITFLTVEFEADLRGAAAAFGSTALGASLAGLYISKMKQTDYRKLIIFPTVVTAAALALMAAAPNAYIFVGLVIVSIGGTYFRGAGITVLENEQISAERATALSFLNTVRSAFWAIGPLLWGVVIDRLGIRGSFRLAAVMALASLGLLLVALRLERETS